MLVSNIEKKIELLNPNRNEIAINASVSHLPSKIFEKSAHP